MHLEILVEDQSGRQLVEHLLPKILGAYRSPHSWQLHHFRGVGRIPKNLEAEPDPRHRMLLDSLPKFLRGYSQMTEPPQVVVVVDVDDRDCRAFLAELQALASTTAAELRVLFRIAVEETEAWILGDPDALLEVYPKAKKGVLDRYVQDSVCGTWEVLADALHPGGAAAVKKTGWPLPGQLKSTWAESIGPRMNPERNTSPSFRKFRDGLRRVAGFTA